MLAKPFLTFAYDLAGAVSAVVKYSWVFVWSSSHSGGDGEMRLIWSLQR